MASNEITMPKLSDTMEEGKIIRWLKRPGDAVARGEALADVETDKADMVLEAFEDGVLGEIKLKEGESAPVGAVIAVMKTAGEAGAPQPSREKPAAEAQPAGDGSSIEADAETESEDTPAPEGPEFHPAMGANLAAGATAMARPPRIAAVKSQPETAPRADEPKLKASPLARRAAEEAGIDLGQVRGTGPDGRITKRDLDNYLREQQMFRVRRLVSPDKGAPGSHEDLSRMRKTIANRMAASKREIPHFYVTVEIDMEEAVKLKRSLEQSELFDQDITYNDIIVKGTALALGRYPRMNSSYENDGITIRPQINIGVAVAVEDGLIVPVIRDCERLSLPEIARKSHLLVGKAARGGFTADELSGATFTISNMGMLGIEHFAAVINPPQAAILAVSAIKDRPVVRDGKLAVGKTMMVTLSCDHRIVDGVVAGRFLQELKRFLENPATLLVQI
jgi:pyruvate dehydrogenase E2 component (dihydrolipoamide acetyltransferase)